MKNNEVVEIITMSAVPEKYNKLIDDLEKKYMLSVYDDILIRFGVVRGIFHAIDYHNGDYRYTPINS